MSSDTLAAVSLLAIYSAAAVYVLAFIAYTWGLAKRSSRVIAAQAGAQAAQAESMSTGSGTTLLASPAVKLSENKASRVERVALALTVLGFVLHVGGVVLRGFAAGRVPWVNMYEFAITGTAVIVGVFLLAGFWRSVQFLGAYLVGMVVSLLTLATINVYVDVVPLPPPLQSAWLVIHVLVAILATGFFALGAGLSLAQLFRLRQGSAASWSFLRSFPSASTLEDLAYRVNVIGFAFWTFTLIAGAIWAEQAWGRYWGFDTKEVWTFVIWVVYAGYIHARATRGWQGARSAWLSLIGFAAVLFNFTIVNLFFTGLHSYSGL